MNRLVIGLLQKEEETNVVINHLKELGINPKNLSVVVKDGILRREVIENSGNKAVEGTMTGVATGGVVAGLAGLLVGIGALTIPGIGAVLIGGPLVAALGLTGATATAVSAAVTGALAGGIVGGLVGLGIPQQEAQVYEDRINTGSILLVIPVDNTNEAKVVNELKDHDAEEIKTIDLPESTRTKWPLLDNTS